jgi:hypothetical protein
VQSSEWKDVLTRPACCEAPAALIPSQQTAIDASRRINRGYC